MIFCLKYAIINSENVAKLSTCFQAISSSFDTKMQVLNKIISSLTFIALVGMLLGPAAFLDIPVASAHHTSSHTEGLGFNSSSLPAIEVVNNPVKPILEVSPAQASVCTANNNYAGSLVQGFFGINLNLPASCYGVEMGKVAESTTLAIQRTAPVLPIIKMVKTLSGPIYKLDTYLPFYNPQVSLIPQVIRYGIFTIILSALGLTTTLIAKKRKEETSIDKLGMMRC